MRDYCDYLNDSISEQYELEEKMEMCGCGTIEEYADYMADLEADAQTAHWEALQEDL